MPSITARRLGVITGSFALLIGTAMPGKAQIAVVALDGKQPHAVGEASGSGPDSVAVIDLNAYPPRVVGSLPVPASMIGPPTSVAVARDESFAIVTAAQAFDPAEQGKLVPGDRVSVIDLEDRSRPVLVQSLASGAGASGVSINRAGTLALIANALEGTVSVFAIANKRLTPVHKVQLDAQLGPADVAISPDGTKAWVAQRRGQAVWQLKIDGTRVSEARDALPVGVNPFGTTFARNGRLAYTLNQLGRLPPEGPVVSTLDSPAASGTVSVIDVRRNTIVSLAEVGVTPEHMTISPNGKFLGVMLVNGSAGSPGTPGYNPFSIFRIYRIKGRSLKPLAETRIGRLGQGATWSRDGRTLLLLAAIPHEIEVHKFDGKRLQRDDAATLRFAARPGAIATFLDP